MEKVPRKDIVQLFEYLDVWLGIKAHTSTGSSGEEILL